MRRWLRGIKRSRLLTIGTVGVVALGGLAYVLLSGDGSAISTDPIEPGDNVAEAFLDGPRALVYLNGTVVQRLDLEENSTSDLVSVPEGSTLFPSLTSHYIAYVTEDEGAEDGLTEEAEPEAEETETEQLEPEEGETETGQLEPEEGETEATEPEGGETEESETEAETEGGETEAPEIRVFRLEASEDGNETEGGETDEDEAGPIGRVVARGAHPLWHPRGGRFAYLRPVAGTRCGAESCSGDVSVHLASAEPSDSETEELLPSGEWRLLGWAGDTLLVAEGRGDDAQVVAVDEDEGSRSLEMSAGDFVSASPDGRYVVHRTETEDSPVVAPMNEDGELEEGPPIPDRGNEVLEVTWAPDSSLLAVWFELPGGAEAGSEIAVFDPEELERTDVPRSLGAQMAPFWAADASGIAFWKHATAEFEQAFHCFLDEGCRPLFTWRLGVTLLRAE